MPAASDPDRWLPFTDAELRLLRAGLLRLLALGPPPYPNRRVARAMADAIAAERVAVRTSPATMSGIRIEHRAIARSRPALERYIAGYLERWPSMPYGGRASEPAQHPDGRWWAVLSHDPKGS